MQKIDNVIDQILNDKDMPDIQTSAARKAAFNEEIRIRVQSKKGIWKTIEVLRCIPVIYRFHKNEGNKV